MAITATTVQELVQSIDTNIRNKTARNSITPTTHSDVLTEAVQVLSGSTFTGNTSGDCISELWVSSISGCSPVTIGEANFPEGITVSGESVSTQNQTEIISTQLIDRTMDSGATITIQSFTANYKHPSGCINTSQTFFRPSDVTSRDTIIYGTPSIIHADYGTIDVSILGLGLTETLEISGLTTGTTTVSCGWNGIAFSGTITVIYNEEEGGPLP
jgi:hypothetical protein